MAASLDPSEPIVLKTYQPARYWNLVYEYNDKASGETWHIRSHMVDLMRTLSEETGAQGYVYTDVDEDEELFVVSEFASSCLTKVDSHHVFHIPQSSVWSKEQLLRGVFWMTAGWGIPRLETTTSVKYLLTYCHFMNSMMMPNHMNQAVKRLLCLRGLTVDQIKAVFAFAHPPKIKSLLYHLAVDAIHTTVVLPCDVLAGLGPYTMEVARAQYTLKGANEAAIDAIHEDLTGQRLTADATE